MSFAVYNVPKGRGKIKQQRKRLRGLKAVGVQKARYVPVDNRTFIATNDKYI